MTTTAMVDTYVRHLLDEAHGEDLEVLDGGGYEVPVAEEVRVRVWVLDGTYRTRRVLVTARVIGQMDADPELFEALNDLNAVTPYGRYFWADGGVIVEDTVLAEDLEPAALFASIGFVAWATEKAAARLLEQFFDDAEPSQTAASVGEVDLPDRAAPLVGTAAAGPGNGAAGWSTPAATCEHAG